MKFTPVITSRPEALSPGPGNFKQTRSSVPKARKLQTDPKLCPPSRGTSSRPEALSPEPGNFKQTQSSVPRIPENFVFGETSSWKKRSNDRFFLKSRVSVPKIEILEQSHL
jgi:hypothetical protein